MTIGNSPGLSLDAARGAGVEASLGPRSRKAQIAHFLQRDGVGALVVLVVFATFASISVSGFGSAENLRNILINVSFPAIIAIGMTIVIISGGIDLSVGSVFALAAILSTKVLDTNKGWGRGMLLALVLSLGAALLIGVVQGLLVARVGLPPFIVTLAGLYGIRGLVFYVSHNGDDVYAAPPGGTFYKLGQSKLFTLHYAVWIAVALYLVFHVVLTRTSFGLTTFAIGGSEDASSLMGLKVRPTKARLYVTSAGLAGLAGVLSAAYSQSGTPDVGRGFELNAIAAVVIGGTLLTGGAGSLIGTAAGVLLLGVVQSYINLGTSLPQAAQQVVTGVFVIGVVIVQRYLNRVQRR
ncbi:MAG: galactofuranose transport system permease protein [Frankiaceae bacterium]|jgi:ribose transport system permease protein|nr:galactofuranose transport system permease protein [Frankiaceae bacterium]